MARKGRTIELFDGIVLQRYNVQALPIRRVSEVSYRIGFHGVKPASLLFSRGFHNAHKAFRKKHNLVLRAK